MSVTAHKRGHARWQWLARRFRTTQQVSIERCTDEIDIFLILFQREGKRGKEADGPPVQILLAVTKQMMTVHKDAYAKPTLSESA